MEPFELSNYKDIDNNILPIVNQYYSLLDAGNYSGAYAYLQSHRDDLKGYFVDSNSFNKIELAIYRLAQLQTYGQRITVSRTEPDVEFYRLTEGSEWLQEVDYGD